MTDKSLEAHFVKCLKEGNTKKALYIIKLLGDKVNNLYRGKSPLCWAKEFENDEVARVLEEKGAVEEAISELWAFKLGKELIEEARVGDLDAVIELVGKGAKVNEKDEYGFTALIWASKYGHLRIAETLIESRTDVNQKDDSGWSALMFASNQGHLGIVELLIEKGADVNQKSKYEGTTALIKASENGHLEIVETLIEKGADVNQKTDYGKTVLMGASIEGNLEIVEKLIIKGADVHQKDIDGNTAMSLAKDEETRKAILKAVKLKKQKDKENEPGFMEKMKGLFGKGE